MPFLILADGVALLHLVFVVFTVFGGLLVLKWRRCARLHLPTVVWVVAVECFGLGCPLTPLEKWLRVQGGETAYAGGFIAHYLLPLVYAGPLTRGLEMMLGLSVLIINVAIYGCVWRRSVKSKP